jgi:N-acetylmuramoyl-L-alanine amidase
MAGLAAAPPARLPPPVQRPAPHVPLTDTAERFGLTLTPSGKTVRLTHSLADLVLEADSRQMRFNGVLVWLNDGVHLGAGKWSISEADSMSVLSPLLDPQRAPPIVPPATVILDPGHGGNDTGARAAGIGNEKAITLTIARLVAERLRASDVEVRLTRDKDDDLALAARARIAATHGADVFVSIHLNSAPNTTVAGVETYLLAASGFNSTLGHSRDTDNAPGNRYDAASQLLAYDVHRAMLARSKAPDRGIRRARFEVLATASCPAILVECGFMSNPREAASMSMSAYRARLADGITHGILSYLSRCEAQARRLDPIHPIKPPESDPGTVQTGRTDRAGPVRLPDGTAR